MYEALMVYALSIFINLLLGSIVFWLNPRAIQKRGIPFLVLVGIVPGFNAMLMMLLAIVVVFLVVEKHGVARDQTIP